MLDRGSRPRTSYGARLLSGGVPIWEALRRQRRTGYWIA
ncbi:hypothetical protein ANDA3_4207 [plant metagenome]|uniref:Uncharacterized protein n=1 Tax=plant metagenome TaxID=1297885 RepID=A0A484PXH9_9ZZZZ